jgi:hypothetical protein
VRACPAAPLPPPPTTQARNNARVLVSGSLDLFSDELLAAPVKVAAGGKE